MVVSIVLLFDIIENPCMVYACIDLNIKKCESIFTCLVCWCCIGFESKFMVLTLSQKTTVAQKSEQESLSRRFLRQPTFGTTLATPNTQTRH